MSMHKIRQTAKNISKKYQEKFLNMTEDKKPRESFRIDNIDKVKLKMLKM